MGASEDCSAVNSKGPGSTSKMEVNLLQVGGDLSKSCGFTIMLSSEHSMVPIWILRSVRYSALAWHKHWL